MAWGESCIADCFSNCASIAELTNRGDRLQSEVHQVNIKARYLKFVILSGYGEHSTVNRWEDAVKSAYCLDDAPTRL